MMWNKRRSLKEIFKQALKGEGSITPSEILSNLVKVKAKIDSGRLKLV